MIRHLLRLFRPTVKSAAGVMNEHRMLSEKERGRAKTAQLRAELKLDG